MNTKDNSLPYIDENASYRANSGQLYYRASSGQIEESVDEIALQSACVLVLSAPDLVRVSAANLLARTWRAGASARSGGGQARAHQWRREAGRGRLHL
jgi:hypothetical protein